MKPTESEQAATEAQRAVTKNDKPVPAAKVLPKKSSGMTRKGFGQLLKRAFTPADPKHAAKVP
jgi:hypothetical protein